jgi:hypothetical protein
LNVEACRPGIYREVWPAHTTHKKDWESFHSQLPACHVFFSTLHFLGLKNQDLQKITRVIASCSILTIFYSLEFIAQMFLVEVYFAVLMTA